MVSFLKSIELLVYIFFTKYCTKAVLYISSIIHKLNRTPCGLDHLSTKLLMSHLSFIINIILRIVNLCFLVWCFSSILQVRIISPLIKKQGLDSEI